MKKIYRVVLLLIILIFSTTYVTKEHKLNDQNFGLFKIKNIEILNNHLIKKKKIKENLSNIYNKNIFFLTRLDIEMPLKQLDFFKFIEVKKKYPNTITIKIFETEPVAIFFEKKHKYLLDNSSNLIKFRNEDIYEKLPNIFGEGANFNFIYFTDQLKKNSFPLNRIKNFYYFKIGRWDIQLFNDKIIKFPYLNKDLAIKKSIELLNRQDFENYKIIDLRVHDKIIVE
jgi:cell division septal protein FtsQ